MSDELKLLVVEDDPADYRLLELELRRQGVKAACTCVNTWDQLSAAIESDGWDAVLSDYHVPGVEFRDTLKLVHGRDPMLPVILVTGTVGEQEAVELLKAGAWDFLLKDRPARLSSVIGRTLREAEERRKRHEAEEALRQREALLDAFFQSSPAGLAVLDTEGRHVRVNEALAASSGLPLEAHIGKSVAEVVPQLAAMIEPIVRSVVRTGDAVLDMEVSGETPRLPGHPAHWLVSHFPILAPDGSVSAVGAFVTDITARKRAEEALKESEARARELLRQNRLLTHRTFRLLEKERRHLAQELHDEMGQWLTAIQAEAEAIRIGCEVAPDSPIHASALAISDCAAEVHAVIRRLVRELRPAVLDVLGLSDALEELVAQWGRHHAGVACSLEVQGDVSGLGEQLNITIYRIVQEALTNVAKHAHASRVAVRLERRDAGGEDTINLAVENDGHGLPARPHSRGTGLAGMRERAMALSGRFRVVAPPGDGVCIEASLPVCAEMQEDKP